MRHEKSAKSAKSSLLTAGTLIALLLLALLMRRQLLQLVGDHLVRDDPIGEPAEVAMLLMGDAAGTRAERAAALYEAHKVRKIVIAEDQPTEFVRLGLQKSDAAMHAEFLRQRGVAASDIVILGTCAADSTLAEARCLRAYVSQGTPPRGVLVITSWYHSARAGWLFERVFAETGVKVQVAAASGKISEPQGWWERKDDFLAVFNEYLKQLYWLTKQPA